MIFYFSATGNSKHVATEIANKTGDKLVDIVEYVNKNNFNVESGENVGIISPTYFWKLPSIVDEFMEKLQLVMSANTYSFFIATYGTLSGQTGRLANEFMLKGGHPFKAFFSVKMPDTWTPVFNLSDKAKLKRINEKADIEIDNIIRQITQRECGNYMHNRTPHLFTGVQSKQYENVRKTKHFKVEDNCIGCGLCAKKCPVSAIEMKDCKPEWVKDKCVMCLGCLHRCPKFSIQYGNGTKKHGQYTHPSYK
jgi:flavodoxin/NAD-dependent dihydropyrimidine dehydrogenase PreA subunit